MTDRSAPPLLIGLKPLRQSDPGSDTKFIPVCASAAKRFLKQSDYISAAQLDIEVRTSEAETDAFSDKVKGLQLIIYRMRLKTGPRLPGEESKILTMVQTPEIRKFSPAGNNGRVSG